MNGTPHRRLILAHRRRRQLSPRQVCPVPAAPHPIPHPLKQRAEVHCYACDEKPEFNYGDILLPSLAEQLGRMGVLQDGRLVVGVAKEKSLLEMNVDMNSTFTFSMVGQSWGGEGETKRTRVKGYGWSCTADNSNPVIRI